MIVVISGNFKKELSELETNWNKIHPEVWNTVF